MMRYWSDHGMRRMSYLAEEKKDSDLYDKEGEAHYIQDGTTVQAEVKTGQALKRGASSNSIGSETSKSSRRSQGTQSSRGTFATVSSEAKAQHIPSHVVKDKNFIGS